MYLKRTTMVKSQVLTDYSLVLLGNWLTELKLVNFAMNWILKWLKSLFNNRFITKVFRGCKRDKRIVKKGDERVERVTEDTHVDTPLKMSPERVVWKEEDVREENISVCESPNHYYPYNHPSLSPCTVPSNKNNHPELPRLILSFAYTSLFTLLNAYIVVVVHDRAPDRSTHPPLPDLLFDQIAYSTWAFQASEATVMSLALIFITLIAFHKHRFVILRRFFIIYGTVVLIRCPCLLFTSLPISSPHMECDPMMTDAYWSKLHRALLVYSKFGMSSRGVKTCGDFMFSGHTVAISLFNYFITEYTPYRLLHVLSWCLAVSGMILIVTGHAHYTVDVIVAFVITTLYFRYYHVIVNSCNTCCYNSNNVVCRNSAMTKTRDTCGCVNSYGVSLNDYNKTIGICNDSICSNESFKSAQSEARLKPSEVVNVPQGVLKGEVADCCLNENVFYVHQLSQDCNRNDDVSVTIDDSHETYGCKNASNIDHLYSKDNLNATKMVKKSLHQSYDDIDLQLSYSPRELDQRCHFPQRKQNIVREHSAYSYQQDKPLKQLPQRIHSQQPYTRNLHDPYHYHPKHHPHQHQQEHLHQNFNNTPKNSFLKNLCLVSNRSNNLIPFYSFLEKATSNSPLPHEYESPLYAILKVMRKVKLKVTNATSRLM